MRCGLQRIYYEKQLLQLDRARQADLEELRRREEAHKEEITRLEDRTTKARVLCRQSLREVAEAKKETAEANIHWGTKLAQANGEIASLRKQLEAEVGIRARSGVYRPLRLSDQAPDEPKTCSFAGGPSNGARTCSFSKRDDKAYAPECGAAQSTRGDKKRVRTFGISIAAPTNFQLCRLSEIRRQRSSDVDAFTGDLAVARHQLKVLERNVRSFLNKAAADKENPGKIFDAKDLGHAKRLANIAAEMDKANNFLSEMKLSALNLRDET